MLQLSARHVGASSALPPARPLPLRRSGCFCEHAHAGAALPPSEPRRDRLMRSGDGGGPGDPLRCRLPERPSAWPQLDAAAGGPASIEAVPAWKGSGELGCDAQEAGLKGLFGADAARWCRGGVAQPEEAWRRASAALISEPTSMTSLHVRTALLLHPSYMYTAMYGARALTHGAFEQGLRSHVPPSGLS